MQSTQPSPGVFGPLPQGTRPPEIIFLLVEGRWGARIEKRQDSQLPGHSKVRRDL